MLNRCVARAPIVVLATLVAFAAGLIVLANASRAATPAGRSCTTWCLPAPTSAPAPASPDSATPLFHTSLSFLDSSGYVAHVNGFHNWTQFQSQNWGASDGNGGGYNAGMYLAAFNRNLDELGNHVSGVQYPVVKRGSSAFKWTWNFGNEFRASWPIEEGAGQLNSEQADQWVWAWAYGP